MVNVSSKISMMVTLIFTSWTVAVASDSHIVTHSDSPHLKYMSFYGMNFTAQKVKTRVCGLVWGKSSIYFPLSYGSFICFLHK